MTAVTIVGSGAEGDTALYWAIAPRERLQTAGRTAGEALDALSQRLGQANSATLLVVLRPETDTFFTEEQIRRLQELMDRSRSAGGLTDKETAERDTLIEAELLASARRTASLADALGQ